MPGEIPSWEDCFSGGMTITAAAASRRCSVSAAHKWAARRGVVWPSGTIPEARKRITAEMEAAMPAETYDDHDLDWRACYSLWSAVLLDQWKTATGISRAYSQPLDRHLARMWFGGKDFRFICGILGLDADAVYDRYRRAIAPIIEQEKKERTK